MRAAFAPQPALAATLIEPDPGAIVAPLAAPALDGERADGLDLILEGFLLHHGSPRHLQVADGKRILAGDYCYAHGLVHVAKAGDLTVIAHDRAAISSWCQALREADEVTSTFWPHGSAAGGTSRQAGAKKARTDEKAQK